MCKILARVSRVFTLGCYETASRVYVVFLAALRFYLECFCHFLTNSASANVSYNKFVGNYQPRAFQGDDRL